MIHSTKFIHIFARKKQVTSRPYGTMEVLFQCPHTMDIVMDIELVREHTLSLLGVTEDQPFGDDIITFRIEGKIFLCLWLGGGQHGFDKLTTSSIKNSEPRFALKLTPDRNEELRIHSIENSK